jgi:hypothetical protein
MTVVASSVLFDLEKKKKKRKTSEHLCGSQMAFGGW